MFSVVGVLRYVMFTLSLVSGLFLTKAVHLERIMFQLFLAGNTFYFDLSVIQISETVKVKQTPMSVLSVCMVSHWQIRDERVCRTVELRTTKGVGNSRATEAVFRFS